MIHLRFINAAYLSLASAAENYIVRLMIIEIFIILLL